MSMPPVQEREIRNRITPAEKFRAELSAFGAQSLRIGVATLLLIPLIVGSFLTLDIPVRFFNRLFFMIPDLRPSVWLTWGHVTIAIVPFVALMFTRRYGGAEGSRAVILAWLIVAVLVLFELSVLSAAIVDGDFPSARFMIAFVASAMTGQLVAVAFYDVARGGGAWWRAPFYSLLVGFAITSVMFFSIAYWQSQLPWGTWLVGDLITKTLLATAFLPIYSVLRKKLVPRGGYGGK